MMGRVSTRAPAVAGRPTLGSGLTAAVPGYSGRRSARRPGRHRAAGKWHRRRPAGPVRRGCFRPAGPQAVPGPGAATGGGPCSGPLPARRPWKPRNRHGKPTRSFPPCRPAPVPALRLVCPPVCPAVSGARPPCPDQPDGHCGPLRRSRCCAAVAARLSARLPVPRERARSASGRQAGATLGATGRDDGAAGPGAHTQPEAVGLRAPAVVRLVGALAHVRLSVVGRPRRETPRSWWSRPPRRRPRSVLPGRRDDRTLRDTSRMSGATRAASTHHPSRGRESSPSSLGRGAITVKPADQYGHLRRSTAEAVVFTDADKGQARRRLMMRRQRCYRARLRSASPGPGCRRQGKTGHGGESFGTVNPASAPGHGRG